MHAVIALAIKNNPGLSFMHVDSTRFIPAAAEAIMNDIQDTAADCIDPPESTALARRGLGLIRHERIYPDFAIGISSCNISRTLWILVEIPAESA